MSNDIDDKKIEIKFGGDLKEIDVDLLVESLVNYSNVTQEVSTYLVPGSSIDIKIKAPESGSFILLLDLIAENASDLFTKDNLSLAAKVTTLVGGLYKFKQWISKNGKPDKVKEAGEDYFEVSNNNGKIVIDKNVYNIYRESSDTRKNIRDTFDRLKQEEEIKDFSISDIENNEKIFHAEKKEFESLASDKDELDQETQKVIKESQELSVFKVVFRENYKWQFFYRGNKIYADFDDSGFFSKIEQGEVAFRSGDKLIADLEIKQVFNNTANTFVNDSYRILEVKEHIPRSDNTQTNLDFEDL